MTISEKLYKKIWYLCSKINNVEWSGVLFWKYEGNLENEETFKIVAEDVYPMHKGSQAYTEFVFDDTVFTYQMDNDLLDCKIGLIHSHNNMGVFFSGTDNEELQENAGNHNTYLSLIVNNRMEFKAKLAIKGQMKSEARSCVLTNPEGEEYTINLVDRIEDVVFNYDIDIEVQQEEFFDISFTDRVNTICTPVAKVSKGSSQKVQTVDIPAFKENEIEKFLITFLGGAKKDTLDSVLSKFKYLFNHSPNACISAGRKKFNLKTVGEELEFIEAVVDALSPYEFDNLEDMKNAYNSFLMNEPEATIPSPKTQWNGWNWSY